MNKYRGEKGSEETWNNTKLDARLKFEKMMRRTLTFPFNKRCTRKKEINPHHLNNLRWRYIGICKAKQSCDPSDHLVALALIIPFY